MNNPDRDQYMSKSKDTVSVCLIDHVLPGGPGPAKTYSRIAS